MEMNLTGDVLSENVPSQLKGLRKRWTDRKSQSGSLGLDAESVCDVSRAPSEAFFGDSAASAGLVSHIATPLTDNEFEVQHDIPSQIVNVGDAVNFSAGSATNYNSVTLNVVDPAKREADWQSLAREAHTKRARQFYKLPWEFLPYLFGYVLGDFIYISSKHFGSRYSLLHWRSLL